MKAARWIALLCLWFGGQPLGATVAPTLEKPSSEPVYDIHTDDALMNTAMELAMATLPQFYERLAAPQPGDAEFMIKFDILPGDEAEFVWATDLDRSQAPMTGRLLNQPVYTNHRIGQRVPIAEAEIVDWTYRQGRVMQGGYTNRVLLERMPPEEAAAFRAYLGW